MTARQAIKQELSAIEEKIAELTPQAEALRAALAALNGSAPAPRRSRKSMKRVDSNTRRTAVLDYLREHPQKAAGAADLARAIGAPSTSLYRVIRDMVVEGEVDQVAETSHGQPIVKHRPVTVVPGEGIQDHTRTTGHAVA